jgi:hypothetical protein
MRIRNEILSLVRLALDSVYSQRDVSIANKSPLHDINGRLRQVLEDSLRELSCPALPSDLEVTREMYWGTKELKRVRFGHPERNEHRRPSIIVHQRGTNTFNILAMKIKIPSRTSVREEIENYWNCCGFALDRDLRYHYALCLELEHEWPSSKAFLTSRKKLTSLDSASRDYDLNTFWDAAKRLEPLTAADIRNVEDARGRLFKDVSLDVFGKRPAKLS